MTPQIPIRVFLLSGSQFLSQALRRAMERRAGILVVGACPYSINASVAIVESTCDVLLADSVSVLALDSQIPGDQSCSFPHLKVVMIEMDENAKTSQKFARLRVMRSLSKEAAVADVISTIQIVANGENIYSSRLHLMRA
jgi:DNA-binding NarL/FixJ family response regulator